MGSSIDRFLAETQDTTPPGRRRAANPIDRFLAEPPDRGRLPVAAKASAGRTPEQAARILKLRDRTRLPIDLIERNLDRIEAETRSLDFDPETYRRASPLVAQWASEHPAQFSVAENDLPQLAALEEQVRFVDANRRKGGLLRALVKGWGTGVVAGEQGVGHAAEAIGEETAPFAPALSVSVSPGMGATPGVLQALGRFLKRDATESFEFYRPRIQSYQQVDGAGDLGEYLLFQVGQGVGSMASVFVGAAVAGPVGGFAAGGTLAYGDVRDELEQLGPDAQAHKNVIALALAIPIAALDQITPGEIAGKLAAKGASSTIVKEAAEHGLTRTVVGALVRGAVQEGGTEVAQEMIQYLGTRTATGQGVSLQEGVPRMIDAFIGGVMGGGVVGGLSGGVDAIRARQNADVVQSVAELATTAQMAEAAPAQLEEIVRRVTEGTGAEMQFVDVGVWTEYFQSKGIDPATQAEEVIGNRDAYDEAVRTGGDLAIPTARYAATLARDEAAHAFFVNELRADPGEMSLREVEERAEAIEAQEAAEASPALAGAQQVARTVEEQLVGAGFDEETARTYAGVYEAAFRTLGERTGIDPSALLARYNLSITRGEAQPSPARESVDVAAMAERQAVEGEAAADPYAVEPRERDWNLQTPEGEFAYARDRRGSMRPVERVALRGLAEEYARLVEANSLDQGMTALQPVENSEFNTIVVNTLGRTRALGRIAARQKSIDRIEAELQRRGIDPTDALADAFTAEPDAATEFEFEQAPLPGFEAELVPPAPLGPTPASTLPVLPEQWRAGTDAEIAQHLATYREWFASRGWAPRDVRVLQAFVARESAPPPARKVTHFDVAAATELTRIEGEMTRRGKPTRATTLVLQQPGRATRILDQVREFFGSEPSPRGRIRIGHRTISIELFEQADLSTFLHETAHFYLEVLADLATDPKVGDRVRADFDVIREWVGASGTEPFTREQHEQFARGFEAYLMEGKAPTPTLRAAFARFRAWLVAIYRQMATLDVKLTDEVRGVFDRLLATEDEIQAAQADAGMVSLFPDPEAVGMSEQQAARYRERVERARHAAEDEVAGRLIRDFQREASAVWKAERLRMRETVTAELSTDPVYQALAMFQRGTLPDGSPLPDGVRAVKLAKDSLVAAFGPEIIKRLPRPRLYGVTATETVDLVSLDVAAEMYGFPSGVELVQAMIDAEPMRAAVERLTTERMKAEHPELLSAAELPVEAMKAVHNEKRADVLRAEMEWLASEDFATFKGLAKRLMRRLPTTAALRAQAEASVARQVARNVSPQMWLHAEQKAGRAKREAFAKGDWEGAFTALLQEAQSHALYRAASEARDTIESVATYMARFNKASTRERIGKAGGDYLEQIDAIRERYSFERGLSRRGVDRRASLREWVREQERQGIPVDLPSDVLDESKRLHYRELTVETLIGVRDAVRQIEHLARVKTRLLKAKRRRELEEAATVAETTIIQHARKVRPAEVETHLPGTEGKRRIETFFAAHRKYASVMREMDGFVDGGPLWEMLVQPLNEAATEEAVQNEVATKALDTIFREAYSPTEMRAMYAKQPVPGTRIALSKMGRLMVALNWGNEINRKRILDGYRADGWTATTVDRILDTLDERDLRFVQAVWDLIDSYWPALESLGRSLHGVPPKRVEASPFTTKAGLTLKGGYFPIRYNDRRSQMAHEQQAEAIAQRIMQGAAVRATTERGMMEARVEGTVEAPVRLDFSVIFEHVSEVIHTTTHTETLIDVSRVLGHERVRSAIVEHYGDIPYRQLTNTIRDVAAGDLPTQSGIEGILTHLRQGTTIVGLGWSLMTSLLQPMGLSNSVVRIGPKWVGRGVARWLTGAARMESTVGWVHEKSAFMRLRHKTMQREINEIRNTIGLEGGNLSGWVDQALSHITDQARKIGIADSYFWLIGRAQMIADVPTWLGMYEKQMAEGVEEGTAIALADQAVLDSQGGGQIKDLASVQRGGPLLKIWTNFYSYFNVVHNQLAESVKRRDLSQPAEIGRLAVDVFLLISLPSVLATVLRDVVKGEDDEDLWTKIAVDQLAYLMGLMLLTRELGGAVSGYFGYEGPAGSRFFAEASNLIRQISQGTADSAFWKALNETAGILFHYPASQVQRTVEGILALTEGRTRNPLAILFGPPKD